MYFFDYLLLFVRLVEIIIYVVTVQVFMQGTEIKNTFLFRSGGGEVCLTRHFEGNRPKMFNPTNKNSSKGYEEQNFAVYESI